MGKYGFVYIWYDRKHKRYYIGCHWGYESDGYICSSPWMKQAFIRRSEDFKRRILKTNIKSRKELYEEELRWLKMIKPSEIKTKYYNLNISNNEVWSKYDEKIKTIKEKISIRTKEAMQRPELKEYLKEAYKKRNTRSSDLDVREKRRQSMIGKNVGKDNSKAIEASAIKRKGVPLSKEHRNKISLGLNRHKENRD